MFYYKVIQILLGMFNMKTMVVNLGVAVTTLRIMALSKTTLSIMDLIATLSITTLSMIRLILMLSIRITSRMPFIV